MGTMQRSILLLVFGLAASVFAFAQDDEWRDIQRDERDIYRDRVDLREDYAKLRRDEMNHNWRAAQRDRADIARDRADLQHDYADINEDRREYSRERSWRGRCVDPDHDGDCDFIRHSHRHHHDHWYGTPYGYSSPYWGNYPYPADWNRGWRDDYQRNGNVPPGWRHGRKKGWGNSDLPPGLAKKSGW